MDEINRSLRSKQGKWTLVKDLAWVIAAVTAACGIRPALQGVLRDNSPYITFFPVVLCAWRGEIRDGMVSVLLSAIVATVFVLPPDGSYFVQESAVVWSLIVFVALGIMISILGQRQFETVRKLTAAQEAARISRNRKVAGVNAALDGIIVAIDITARKAAEDESCDARYDEPRGCPRHRSQRVWGNVGRGALPFHVDRPSAADGYHRFAMMSESLSLGGRRTSRRISGRERSSTA